MLFESLMVLGQEPHLTLHHPILWRFIPTLTPIPSPFWVQEHPLRPVGPSSHLQT